MHGLIIFFLCWLLLIFDSIINHAWSIRARALNMCNYTCRDMNSPLHLLCYKIKKLNIFFSELFVLKLQVSKSQLHYVRGRGRMSYLSIVLGGGGDSSGALSAYSCQEKQWSAPRGQIITNACGNRCKHAFLCTRNDSLAITIMHAIHKGCGVQLYECTFFLFFSYLNTHWHNTHTNAQE